MSLRQQDISQYAVVEAQESVRPRYLLTTIQPGLFFSSRIPLLFAMRDLGWDVHAALPEAEEWRHLERDGISIHELRINRGSTHPMREWETRSDFHRAHQLVRPLLAHHFSSKAVIYGSLTGSGIQISTLTGIGFSLSGSGTVAERLPIRVLAPILYRIALGRNSCVIFQNEEDRTEFLRRKLVPANRTRVLPGSGVDMSVYNPGERTDNQERARFVMLSRMIRPKGVFEFVEAARRALTKRPNGACFRLVGPIDKQNPDRIDAEQLEVWTHEGIVEWVGRKPNAIEAYRDASVAVLPSYHEGLPRAVVEAAAMGLPVITTRARGCRDTVVDEVTGYLVPIKDVKQLSERMIQLIDNPKLAEEMGRRGREFVRDRFSVERILEQTLDIYAQQLSRNNLGAHLISADSKPALAKISRA